MPSPLVVTTSPPPAAFFESVLPPGTRVVKAGQSDLLEAVEGAAVVIGDWEHRVKIDAAAIAAMAGCRLIQQPSAGYENIDIEAARAAGILVANAGPANAGAVAELAVMGAIAALRRVREALREAESGAWDWQAWIDRDLPELAESRVGILGFGAIGQEIARRLRPFGCAVMYNRRHRLSPEQEAELGVTYAELEPMLRRSDVLVLAAALNASSARVIDAPRLAMLPADAVLVNVARGGLVDTEALVAALDSGRLAGAALDVFDPEPLPPNHPLTRARNVILTPHIGGSTAASKRRILMNSIANVNRALAGDAVQFVVNR